MKKLFILFAFLMLFIPANAYEFQVKLNINNTESIVYIPGIGEINASDIADAVYTNPLHFYTASYLNNLMTGLVSYSRNPISIAISKSADTHSIQISQNLTNSNIFLVFTKGNWNTIENRIGLIESFKFLSKISPSFSFGLGLAYPIKLILKYSGINIENNLVIQKGLHRLSIKNTGTGIRIESI